MFVIFVVVVLLSSPFPSSSLDFSSLFSFCFAQVVFTAGTALAPPEVQVNLQQQAEYEKQIETAAASALPDEGGDEDL